MAVKIFSLPVTNDWLFEVANRSTLVDPLNVKSACPCNIEVYFFRFKLSKAWNMFVGADYTVTTPPEVCLKQRAVITSLIADGETCKYLQEISRIKLRTTAMCLEPQWLCHD